MTFYIIGSSDKYEPLDKTWSGVYEYPDFYEEIMEIIDDLAFTYMERHAYSTTWELEFTYIDGDDDDDEDYQPGSKTAPLQGWNVRRILTPRI